ncbi:MAG TPA: hypothetical protein PL041_11085, partial [Melioribacteraceae bacterium]|nr:hypothetical protein [Melioribacteraceae bacterium]
MIKRFEIILKNFILKLFLNYYKNNNKIEEIKDFNNKKVLFIRLNRIGDALVTTPLINILKIKLKITVHVLADKKNYFIFAGQRFVDKTFVFKKGLKGFIEFRKTILSENYDCIVDLHDDTSATVSFLLSLVSNSLVFGLKKENLSLYSKTIIRLDSSKYHVVDRIAEIAKLFNISFTKNELNITYEYTTDDVQNVNEFLGQAYLEN